MESEDDLFNQNLDDDNSEGVSKLKLFVISSTADYIQLHLNIHQLKQMEMEQIIVQNSSQNYSLFYQEIIDVTKATRSLTINDIKMLALKDLDWEVDISQISWDLFEHSENSQLEKEEIKYESDNDSNGLKNKDKHQKLSKNQIKYLKAIFMTTELTIKQIQSEYNVSYSVLNKIKRSSLDDLNKYSKRNITKVSDSKEKIIVKLIKKCIQSVRSTTTAKEVTDKVNGKLNTSYSVNFIRGLMKNKANLSFKRVKSRPNSIDMDRIKSIRSLFSIKFAKIVTWKTLLINVDESSINRKVKTSYSWGFKDYQ